MEKDIAYVMHGAEEIGKRVAELGKEITEDYKDKKPVVICILRGAVTFFSDLIRAMPIFMNVDFMAASSYGNSTVSSGELKIKKDLEESIEGRHVILVEDIIDSGLTIHRILGFLKERNPASIAVAALFNKERPREYELDIKYTGFSIEDQFVVGYGLDYAGDYRNLPYIGVLKREVYEGK